MKHLFEFLSSKIKNDPRDLADHETDRFSEPPMTYADAYDKIFDTRTKAFRLKGEMEQKMYDWNAGKRKENIKACNDAKLIIYYKMCKDKGYESCCEKCEDEANRRGWTFKKLK